MNEKINKLKNLRQELLEMQCKQSGHNYGQWNKKQNNQNITYERTCIRCGFPEIINSSTKITEIETEIQKQNKGNELLNYLLNTNKESLTKENLLFFINLTKDYINYMNKDTLKDILTKNNIPTIESLDEYTIIKEFADNIYDVNDDIWNKIQNYTSIIYKEKGSTLK